MIKDAKRCKKFFYRALIFSGLGWFILQFSVYFLCRPPEWYWIRDIIQLKENLATRIPGQKIVFAGGSSTLFGVRTEDIQKELGIPTVNYGIHAALEIDYILQKVKKILKPGDVVIVPLEYNAFLYDGKINEVRARFVLLFDEHYYKSLPFFEKIDYFFKFSPLTIELSLWSAFWKLMGRESSIRSYDLDTLNKHGDITENLGNDIIKKKYDEIKPIEIQEKDELTETLGLKTLRDFNNWAREHNIRFYVTYAPTLFFDVYKSRKYQEYFKKLADYFQQHDIKTIGSPNDFFYPEEFLYDTQYHLNSSGMTRNTQKFIVKLRDLLQIK